jgi:hypothetical protein
MDQSRPATVKVAELTNLPVPIPSIREKLVTTNSCMAVTLPATHLDVVLDR